MAIHKRKNGPWKGRQADDFKTIVPGRKQTFNRGFPCPCCGGHADMPRGQGCRCFGWRDSRGLVHCSRCQSRWPDRNGLTWAHPPGRAPLALPAPVALDNIAGQERRAAILAATWNATVPANAPEAAPMRLYLVSRGLSGRIPPVLRFHPGLGYWEGGNCIGTWPAMVAQVQRYNGCHVTLHRTFLTEDGQKAPVPNPRKVMRPAIAGATTGCAIQLGGEPGHRLAVAEGIETSWAVAQATNYTTWATVSAGGMGSLVVPAWVEELYIAADNDANGTGQLAAKTLARRMLGEGRRVKIVTPPTIGHDWNDVLLEGGAPCWP